MIQPPSRTRFLGLTVAVMAMALGLAGTAGASDSSNDPIESLNRPLYKVNDILDEYVGEPVSRYYINYTPEPLRTCVSSFFDNVSYLNVIVNDFLQGKGEQGLHDSGRLLINTTFGAFGLFDVATPLGLEKHEEDFGQTLAVWGLKQGPYLVLPLLGPNTVRDVPNLGFSTVTNILFYVSNPVAVPVALLGFIDQRSRLDQAVKFRDEAAVEPYLFTREAYLQHRNFLIYDGNPPINEDDLFLDESFAENEGEPPAEAGDETELDKKETDPQANSTTPSNPSSLTVSVR